MAEMQAMYMLGRCANGCEADKGRLYHAVGGWRALCGKEPGRRSAGWSDFYAEPLDKVNCPRCLRKLEQSHD